MTQALLRFGTMHAGNVATSERLRQTLDVLSDGRPHTTREIADRTGSQAVHSDVAALRANGYEVLCSYAFRTPQGNRVFKYELDTRTL